MRALVLAAYAHLPLVVFLGFYLVLMLVLRTSGAPEIAFDPGRVVGVFKVILPMFMLGVLVFFYARLMWVSRGQSPMGILRRWMAQTPWAEVLLLRFPLAILFLIANQYLYVVLKVNIPFVVPFSWDGTFAEWDRTLFGGTDPWRLTHAVFSTPLATAVIDGLYVTWFFVVYLGFLVFAALPMTNVPRLAFLLSFGISWAVGGSLMATFFSSAGPVYVERLFGDPTFVPLMALLEAQAEIYPVHALTVQETLWLGYADPAVSPVGISAFPSMHNCLMAIVLLGAFRLNRWAGWLMAFLTAAVVIGSVHLGWHYAVDSLAGLAIGWLFWRSGLIIARRWLGADAT